MANGSGTTFFQALTWVTNISVPLIMFVIGYFGNILFDNIKNTTENAKTIAAIQANRYTDSDAKNDQKNYYDHMLIMKDLLSSIDKKVPDEIPPSYFVQDVDELRQDVRTMRTQINADLNSIRTEMRTLHEAIRELVKKM